MRMESFYNIAQNGNYAWLTERQKALVLDALGQTDTPKLLVPGPRGIKYTRTFVLLFSHLMSDAVDNVLSRAHREQYVWLLTQLMKWQLAKPGREVLLMSGDVHHGFETHITHPKLKRARFPLPGYAHGKLPKEKGLVLRSVTTSPVTMTPMHEAPVSVKAFLQLDRFFSVFDHRVGGGFKFKTKNETWKRNVLHLTSRGEAPFEIYLEHYPPKDL